MVAFLYNNKSWLIVLGIIVYLVIMYFIFKSLPTKTNKKVNSKSNDSEKIEKKEEKPIESPPPLMEEKAQNEDKKSKKESKKPKIVQIYKREQRNEDGKIETKIDPIYDRNVEFVNTSKNISKFKSFVDEKKEEQKEEIQKESVVESNDDFGFVSDTEKDCEFCENKIKHFDHSIRLSSMMKEDNHDDMFVSHISDKYLNMNSNKHLNLDENYQQKLFDRTNKMMVNGENKLSGENVSAGNLFGDYSDNVDLNALMEDEVKINMKTALIADAYFNRKKRK